MAALMGTATATGPSNDPLNGPSVNTPSTTSGEGKAKASGEGEGEGQGEGQGRAKAAGEQGKEKEKEKDKEGGLTFEKAWILSQVAQGGYL